MKLFSFINRQKQKNLPTPAPYVRQLAFFIDSFITTFLRFLSIAVLLPSVQRGLFSSYNLEVGDSIEPELLLTWLRTNSEAHVFIVKGMLNLILIGIAYYCIQLLIFKTTLGFWIFRISIVKKDGTASSRTRLIIRYFVSWIPWVIVLALFATAYLASDPKYIITGAIISVLWSDTHLFGRNRRMVHDSICGTDVWKNSYIVQQYNDSSRII